MHASLHLLLFGSDEPPSESLNQLENPGKFFRKQKTERKSVFYFLIAAAIVYNIVLAFSKKDANEPAPPNNKELTQSPNLK